jgi:NADH dehydrogenase [ubiquinone] 1 alpha subcomplex assembly factor 7
MCNVTKLATYIRTLTEKTGAISVADYMHLALQHPEFGYYRHGNPLGQGGDFITAPEVSQMFGEMVGLWCADIWQKMGKPETFVLLEMGPGCGTLMQDALRATAKLSGFQSALKLHLLESSETLRASQREKLAAHNPIHITDLTELPALPLITIANEFFDALPIRQFEKSFHGWCERLVTTTDDKLSFSLSQPDEAILLLIPERLREANPGTVFELSPQSLHLMHHLAKYINQRGGAALVIDYGYAEPDGNPTLQAVANHKYSDVLANPGEADITALVDFNLLRTAAMTRSAVAFGPVPQGEFLQTLGIEVRADQLKRTATPEQVKAIDTALHRLTDNAEMGCLFKVLAITSPSLSEVPGF